MSYEKPTLSDAFADYTASYREDQENDELDFLDVEIWKNMNYPDQFRVEFLLTCGGPTVRVMVDEGDRVTFSHSWAVNSIGEPFTENQMSDGDDSDFWVQMADNYRECCE